MITKSSSFVYFSVAHYSKSIKGINIKLAHEDKMQLQDKGYNSESYRSGVIPLLNLKFLSIMMAPDECCYHMRCSCLIQAYLVVKTAVSNQYFIWISLILLLLFNNFYLVYLSFSMQFS